MTPPFLLVRSATTNSPIHVKSLYRLGCTDKLLPTRNSLSTKELLGEFLHKMVSVLVESDFINFCYFFSKPVIKRGFDCISFENMVSQFHRKQQL